MKKIFLASNSIARRDLLKKAKIKFHAIRPKVNENKLKDIFKKKRIPLNKMALFLADNKCNSISSFYSDQLILACDQVLIVENEYLSKPNSESEIINHLKKLQGKTHYLFTANILKKNNKTLWKYMAKSSIRIRKLTDKEIKKYLEMYPFKKNNSIYQIEKGGAHLIETMNGNYYDILGLSLIELLSELRKRELV